MALAWDFQSSYRCGLSLCFVSKQLSYTPEYAIHDLVHPGALRLLRAGLAFREHRKGGP